MSGVGYAGTLSEKELDKQLATLGTDFVMQRVEAPTIKNPHDWINRQAGNFVYRFVEGSDDGAEV